MYTYLLLEYYAVPYRISHIFEPFERQYIKKSGNKELLTHSLSSKNITVCDSFQFNPTGRIMNLSIQLTRFKPFWRGILFVLLYSLVSIFINRYIFYLENVFGDQKVSIHLSRWTVYGKHCELLQWNIETIFPKRAVYRLPIWQIRGIWCYEG